MSQRKDLRAMYWERKKKAVKNLILHRFLVNKSVMTLSSQFSRRAPGLCALPWFVEAEARRRRI